MASTCIGVNRCGSHGTGWLSTQHPFVSDEIVNASACFHWGGSCCLWSINVRFRNCSGFYVYELRPTPSCHYRYCGDGEGRFYWTTYLDKGNLVEPNNKLKRKKKRFCIS